MEAPSKQHTSTYHEVMAEGIRLVQKHDPAKSSIEWRAYRADWLSLLASNGWTEDEWFKAASFGSAAA